MKYLYLPYSLALLIFSLIFISCDDDQDPVSPVEEELVINTSSWEAADIEAISRNSGNTIPNLTLDGLDLMPGYHTWDYWPLLTLDGEIARINNYQVLFALSAPENVMSGKRHDMARIRYAISLDGIIWKDMGYIFEDGDALGSRQWAGSSYFDEVSQRLFMYYTATGEAGEDTDVDNGGGGSGSGEAGQGISYRQRIAMATANLLADRGTVRFDNWDQHQIILEADDQLYRSTGGVDATGTVYSFRGPFVFRDPETEKFYLTFTSREAGNTNDYNGVIGMAESSSEDLSQWRLMEPLISTELNNELERPHHIYHDGRYYLFFSTHIEKFAPAVSDKTDTPEGLYGFVANDLGGPYQPLNGTGLVAANPPDDPYMTFSWHVLPNFHAISNVNYYNVGPDISVSEFGELGEEWDQEHFGGTLAPTLILNVQGSNVTLEGVTDPMLPQ